MKNLIGAIALLLLSAGCAAGDIVYGARYYLPPGSTGTSHSHIYRIEPDGRHRRQLTFGNSDDDSPVWSKDGKWIAFVRTVNPSVDTVLMLMSADGSALHRVAEVDQFTGLEWVPGRQLLCTGGEYRSKDPVLLGLTASGQLAGSQPAPNRYTWDLSPNKRYGYSFDHGHLFDARSDKVIARVPCYTSVAWLSNTRLASIKYSFNGSYEFDNFDLAGKIYRSSIVQDVTTPEMMGPIENMWAIRQGIFDKIRPDPERPGCYIGFLTGRNPTVYLIDPPHKKLYFIAGASNEAWSPDSIRFCTSPCVSTSNYQRRKDGTWRLVWTNPLVIFDLRTNRSTVIQGGLVLCGRADWR